MTRLCKCVALLFVLAIPFWYAPVIFTDLTQPERWSDWRHDPRWYGPLLLLVAAAMAVVFVWAFRWQRRWDRMTPEERAEKSRRILSRRWF